jgi:hypothetical protein
MRVEKLNQDYSKLSFANLKVLSENVVAKLTGNVNFPETRPTLVAFTAMVTAFATAMEEASNGGRVEIAKKKQARAILLTGLRTLATDLNAQAMGDKAKLLSSGLTLASENSSPTDVGQVADYRLVDGSNPGELLASCDRVPGAVNYGYEYTDEMPTADTVWHLEMDTVRTHILKNLPGSKRIYVRIRAFGHRGQESVSAILSRVVQ